MNGLAARMLPYILSFFSSFCIMILELVASRLVAVHVGGSLTVWTSVIGIMLGGICLGNVLGGRLADRIAPARAIGPLYALGAFMTLGCLWMNAVVGFTPGLATMNWNLRTIVVVTLDFLVPGTVLGMIGPVVAKIAVEQARKAGSAIGDIYFWGAVGSIAGTFLAGFILMYVARISGIVTMVAAALCLLSAAMMGRGPGLIVGLLASAFLGLGSIAPLTRAVGLPNIALGASPVNTITLVGHALTLFLAVIGVARLLAAARAEASADEAEAPEEHGSTRLSDLAALSFVASLAFMAFEMVAGRLVTRHLGSSIYGWTSVIGVLLGGLSLGNLLGGKIADYVKDEKQASWLFLIASVLVLSVLVMEKPRTRLTERFVEDDRSVLSRAIQMTKVPGTEMPMPWSARVLFVVTAVFFLPALSLGTVSPVVAKLAVDRLRKSKRTGSAIGQVYAWGMVGSILGTFLTGFVLIDLVGTKAVILLLGTTLALSATVLGSVWHAAWTGLPLGLCVIAFLPVNYFEEQGEKWGIREDKANPLIEKDGLAYLDESDYYYIKVTNEPDADGLKRTLVLDNLIHGYFILGRPDRLDYDYEHIYALVAHRVAEAKAKAAGKSNASQAPLKTLFLGGGAYTFQRYMQYKYPLTAVDVAEIDPAITRANKMALGLPSDTTIQTTWGDARQFVEKNQNVKKYDIVFGDAFNDFSVPWHLTTREFNDKLAKMLDDDGVYMINIIDAYESDETIERKGEKRIATAEKGKELSDAEKVRIFNEEKGKAPRNASDEVIQRKADERIAKEQTPRVLSESEKAWIRRDEKRLAYRYSGFLGAWVNTARLTFPNIYIFGTDDNPGSGLRETFVVVVSKKPLKLDDLASRDDEPQFFVSSGDALFEPRPFSEHHKKQIDVRSRGIILTDDYAPVENLLAPVAETRGDPD